MEYIKNNKELKIHFFSNSSFIILRLQLLFDKIKTKLVGIDWSLLSSSSYTYTRCFSLIGAKMLSKICVLKMKKIENFVSNCSRYRVQPFALEVLISSFERYPS